MTLVASPPRTEPSQSPRALLPARMKVLCVTTQQRTGRWLADAFAADSAAEVLLYEELGAVAGLARLRDESFDAVLVSHEPGELDGVEFVEALRTGGAEEPLLVLGALSESEMTALCFEAGADAYLCVHTTTTRSLLWILARAMERHHLLRENRRLSQGERQRLHHEHQEAGRLLHQQRALLRDLESLRVADASFLTDDPFAPTHDQPAAPRELPPQLVSHYRELLRAHVIMGFGNLSSEMSELAEMLAAAGVTAQQTMLLHLRVLEELIQGLGSRSARHVMTRADLLILDVMIHLTEGYRRRYLERLDPPQQRLLPGFSERAA